MAIKKVTHSRGTSYEVTAKINGRTHRKRFGTKSAALDHQAQIRTQARDGSYVHPAVSKITFGEYSAQWLAGLQVRETTLVSYERNLRNHLLPVFGPVRLRALTRTQVQEFITALSQGPLAPATQRAVINLLRIVLRAPRCMTAGWPPRRVTSCGCRRCRPSSWQCSPRSRRPRCWPQQHRVTTPCSPPHWARGCGRASCSA